MKKLTRKVALNFVIQLHKDRSTDRWLVRQHQHTKSDTRSTKYYIVEEHEILHRGVEIEDTRIYPLLKTNQGYIFRRKFQYDCSPKYYEVLYAVSGRSPWQAHFYSDKYSIIMSQLKKYVYGLMVSRIVSNSRFLMSSIPTSGTFFSLLFSFGSQEQSTAPFWLKVISFLTIEVS